MNGSDSEPGRQLPTTAARENECNATQVTSVLCRRWRPKSWKIDKYERYELDSAESHVVLSCAVAQSAAMCTCMLQCSVQVFKRAGRQFSKKAFSARCWTIKKALVTTVVSAFLSTF